MRQLRKSTVEIRPSFHGREAGHRLWRSGGVVPQGGGGGVLWHQREATREGAAQGDRREQRRVQALRRLLHPGPRPEQRDGGGAGVYAAQYRVDDFS